MDSQICFSLILPGRTCFNFEIPKWTFLRKYPFLLKGSYGKACRFHFHFPACILPTWPSCSISSLYLQNRTRGFHHSLLPLLSSPLSFFYWQPFRLNKHSWLPLTKNGKRNSKSVSVWIEIAYKQKHACMQFKSGDASMRSTWLLFLFDSVDSQEIRISTKVKLSIYEFHAQLDYLLLRNWEIFHLIFPVSSVSFYWTWWMYWTCH